MRIILALCLLVASGAALPLKSESVIDLSSTEKDRLNGKIFLVQVNEAPKREEQQQKREFPWPYPPIFESVLPESVKQQLSQIYEEPTLSAEERANQINSVFDALPQQVIQALPLPVEYERLPADTYKRILYVHTAPGFKWAERQRIIHDIVESLPEEERRLMGTPRMGGPPPGFEYVLAPTVYKQLLFVHYNPRLSKEQKSNMITQIMRQVPAEQLEQLPLPAGMERLPVEVQKRLHSLVYDYSVPQAVRAQRVRDFVQMLPEEIRPQLR
jgi:hypothetical protein